MDTYAEPRDPRDDPDYVPPHEAAARERLAGELERTGASLEVQVFDDYFGMDVRHRTILPDGLSWVEHKELTEGERKRIQNESNRDVRLQKVTGDAVIRSRPGDERHALLEAAIVGWELRRNGEPVPFTTQRKRDFLASAPPKIIDLIQKDIYKFNPWLLNDLSVEDIDKQIEELQEMREVKIREDEGKDSSPR